MKRIVALVMALVLVLAGAPFVFGAEEQKDSGVNDQGSCSSFRGNDNQLLPGEIYHYTLDGLPDLSMENYSLSVRWYRGTADVRVVRLKQCGSICHVEVELKENYTVSTLKDLSGTLTLTKKRGDNKGTKYSYDFQELISNDLEEIDGATLKSDATVCEIKDNTVYEMNSAGWLRLTQLEESVSVTTHLPTGHQIFAYFNQDPVDFVERRAAQVEGPIQLTYFNYVARPVLPEGGTVSLQGNFDKNSYVYRYDAGVLTAVFPQWDTKNQAFVFSDNQLACYVVSNKELPADNQRPSHSCNGSAVSQVDGRYFPGESYHFQVDDFKSLDNYSISSKWSRGTVDIGSVKKETCGNVDHLVIALKENYKVWNLKDAIGSVTLTDRSTLEKYECDLAFKISNDLVEVDGTAQPNNATVYEVADNTVYQMIHEGWVSFSGTHRDAMVHLRLPEDVNVFSYFYGEPITEIEEQLKSLGNANLDAHYFNFIAKPNLPPNTPVQLGGDFLAGYYVYEYYEGTLSEVNAQWNSDQNAYEFNTSQLTAYVVTNVKLPLVQDNGNAQLKSIKIAGEVLTPAFDSKVKHYNVTLGNTNNKEKTVKVHAQTVVSTSQIINGDQGGAQGNNSLFNCTLQPGDTKTVEIKVRNMDGTQESTYTVTLNYPANQSKPGKKNAAQANAILNDLPSLEELDASGDAELAEFNKNLVDESANVLKNLDNTNKKKIGARGIQNLDQLMMSLTGIVPQADAVDIDADVPEAEQVPSYAQPQIEGALAAAGVRSDTPPTSLELKVQQKKNPSSKVKALYEIKLYKNGVLVTLETPVLVTIPVPQNFKQSTGLQVHHTGEGVDEWLPYNYNQEERTVTFQPNSFSTFALEMMPSSGNSSSGDSRPVYSESELSFWDSVEQQIRQGEAGATVTVEASGYEKVPAQVLSALAGKNVALTIRWAGGVFTIPAGMAPKDDGLTLYYSLSELAQLYEGNTGAVAEKKINPDTGGTLHPQS